MDQIDQKYFLLTFDVEDWFQVENLKASIPFSTWGSCELRVEKNVHKILDLLDEVSIKSQRAESREHSAKRMANEISQGVSLKAQGDENPQSARRMAHGEKSMEHQNKGESEEKRPEAWSSMPHASRLTHQAEIDSQRAEGKAQSAESIDSEKSQGGSLKAQGDPSLSATCYELSANTPHPSPKATFFILGWIAERLPKMVQEIVQRGHEVASHGYNHQLCHLCSPESLKEDLVKSKKLLEDLIGAPVNGYRAPSFSINPEVINLLRESGYHYDSSYNSFGINSRYGKLDLESNGTDGIAHSLSDGFYELPVSNFMWGSKVFPLGGGGYFRLVPLPIFNRGVRAIMDKKSAYLFYLHPWELDPGQPRVEGVSRLSQFRHYLNLNKTDSRLSKLINAFQDCRFIPCGQYLKETRQRAERRALRA